VTIAASIAVPCHVEQDGHQQVRAEDAAAAEVPPMNAEIGGVEVLQQPGEELVNLGETRFGIPNTSLRFVCQPSEKPPLGYRNLSACDHARIDRAPSYRGDSLKPERAFVFGYGYGDSEA